MLGLTSPNLDDYLLDVVTAIELSDRDRRVAENRYRRLKEHLERPSCPLARYLADGESRIYAQGSMATGTAVVTGKDEERFDLDALVELKVPAGWTPKQVMDLLYESLKDFPDAVKVVRCTRCVQLQFAFMHMDVTVMDPEKEPRVERAGEIFHSPDAGEAKRVPANPFGFSQWLRTTVTMTDRRFAEILNERRSRQGIDRLSETAVQLKAAQQDDLPPMLPPRLDSEQVVALKLLKRYLFTRYEDRDVKRPPSIYVSKKAVDAPTSPHGLCAQLLLQAQYIESEMKQYIASGQMPDERNPSYRPDRLNDRWPTNRKDMEILAGDMAHLITEIRRAQNSEFSEINKILAGLFGEKISMRSTEALLKRAADAEEAKQGRYEKGTGAVVLAGAFAAPAIARSLAAEPKHNFHCGVLKKKP